MENSCPRMNTKTTKTWLLSVGLIGLALVLGLTLYHPIPFLHASAELSNGAAVVQKTGLSLPSGSGGILSFNEHLIAIAKMVKPAVVNISMVGTPSQSAPFSQFPFFDDPFFRRFFGDRFEEQPRRQPKRQELGMGSGVIITPDGYIVTNNHVVETGDEIQVTLSDKRKFEAKLIGTDPKTDLALIKIEASNLPVLSWGDSANLQVGEMVVAVGNPFGLNQTVTMGIISAVGRANVGIVDYEDFIQTDAAINPGNSGGALVNLRGELIGINTAIFSRSGGYMGIGFAIPSRMAQMVTQGIKEHGKVVRGWLGVSIQEVSHELAEQFGAPDTQGALVAEVVKDSPADEARIKRGDIIRQYDGRNVENPTKLRAYVGETLPGRNVQIEVFREGKLKTLTVKIAEMPKDVTALGTGTVGGDHALSGLTVEPLPPDHSSAEEGVVVKNVDPNSRAAMAGIRKGDVIIEINRTPIRDLNDFSQVTDQLNEGDSVLILLRRGNSTIFLSIGGKR